MLDGYESPTSRTVQVDVGLATLMIISAVAENTNRINIAAQQEQRERDNDEASRAPSR